MEPSKLDRNHANTGMLVSSRRCASMKITFSLDKPKMVIIIEGPDSSMNDLGEVVEQVLQKMKKSWLDTIKRQTKLPETEENK